MIYKTLRFKRSQTISDNDNALNVVSLGRYSIVIRVTVTNWCIYWIYTGYIQEVEGNKTNSKPK